MRKGEDRAAAWREADVKSPTGRTPYEAHKERWRFGCGSDVCPLARHVVFARGQIPCDVLFIGEAPGRSENLLGSPFVGPAGHLIDRMARRALGHVTLCAACLRGNHPAYEKEVGPDGQVSCENGHHGEESRPVRWAFYNLVGCFPVEETEDGRGSVKAGEPEHEQIVSCAPKLTEFSEIARPRLVVATGSMAREYLAPGFKHSTKLHGNPRQVHIVHPAAILRVPSAQQSLMEQRCVVALSSAVRDL